MLEPTRRQAVAVAGWQGGDGFIAPDGIQDSSNSLPPLEPPITNQPPNQIKSTPPTASLLTHTHFSEYFPPLSCNNNFRSYLTPQFRANSHQDAKIYMELPPDNISIGQIRSSQVM